jgi:WD40 repeat protein
LAREFCQVPITALALYRGPSTGLLYVLAAEDNCLRVYEAVSGRPVCRFAVFAEQSIHGICADNGHVLTWGACQAALFSADGLELDRSGAPAMVYIDAPDWIYRAAVSPYDASCLVLVTAHNEAVTVKVNSTDRSQPVLGDTVSPSRPILSAAHLTWLSEDCVLVAGGTFFGEILVWKYYLDRSGDAAYEMLFILTGHEGSIFGMDISQPFVLDDGSTARFLASCSDDRTVRIWDITERPSNSHTRDAARSRLNEIRETGFISASDTTQSEGIDEAATPVAVTMGHISRIWGVKFAKQRTGTSMQTGTAVYSFGEDSTAQRWQLSLAPSTVPAEEVNKSAARAVTGSLLHKQTFSLHQGKNLWSNALLDTDDRTFIAIGGADGKVSLIEDEPIVGNQHQTIEPGKPIPLPAQGVMTFEVRDILANIPSPLPVDGRKEEIVNRYDFISPNEILTTTSWGRLLLGTFKEGIQWQELEIEETVAPDLKTCYALKGLRNGTAVIGTTTGNVYFYAANKSLTHLIKLSGRVVDICHLNSQQSGEQDSTSFQEILVYLYGSSVGQYITLEPATGKVQTHEEVQGLDSRFVALSAARVGNYLLMGSRRGWLAVMKRVDGVFRPVLNLATPTRDAITAMVAIPSTGGGTDSTYFVATSRDGKFRIYKIVDTGDEVQLQLCHETSPPFGPFIEGAWFTNDATPQLIMYGFRSKSFVIWNETLREELATVECGGAHRTYVLFPSTRGSHGFRFAFTKTSKLCMYTSDRVLHKSFKAGLHGREIRALSYNGRYLATGAEDTTVRIWEYSRGEDNSGEPVLRPLASMKAHVAGLQRIRWLGDDYLLSSGGNEEFFIWKVHRLDAGYAGLGVVCEGILTDKSNDADLRITDFDVCWIDGGDSMLITLGYSNTILKTYRYQPGNGFSLVAKGMYTGACLTQIRHLSSWEDGLAVLTASTDGHLAIWELQAEDTGEGTFHLKSAVRLHQSSIKSLDMLTGPDGYRVLTGGDDNALGITTLSQSPADNGKRGEYKVKTRRIIRKAHAAAINGVLMIRHNETDLVAISVSNDQRVKTWRIPENERAHAGLLTDVYSGVADAGDITMLEQGMAVMLAGVGLEAWKFQAHTTE